MKNKLSKIIDKLGMAASLSTLEMLGALIKRRLWYEADGWFD